MTTATQKIPAGYKQTKIGMIPTDWDVVSYDQAFKFLRTAQYSRNQLGKGKNYYVHYGDIHTRWNYFVDFNQDLPTIEDEKISNYSLIEDGDLIMADASEDYAGIGKSVEVKNKKTKSAISGLHTFLLRDKGNYFVKGFRGYIHANPLVKSSMDRLATGLKVYGVSKSNLKLIQIPQPPSSEQSAIATALSDTNALIEKFEKLIEKKKNIKLGAMQELLTGKRRLPGFSGEWIRKKLGEIGEIIGSGVDKKIRPEEVSVRLLNFLDVFHRDFIYSKDLHHEVTARPDQLVRCSIKKGDIFFTPSSEMPFDIGISAISMEDMPSVVYSYHVDRLRLFEDWDLLFRAYIFQTKDFSNQTATYCEGSGKRYVLNLTTFRERLTVFYPVDKKEQSAISQILFDMDAEIEKLESELAKYRNIKQGMMQNLLTGKIRLITK